MKTKILAVSLPLLVLAAGSISVRAEDNPAQAAARVALAKKLFELGQPPAQQPTQSPPSWDSGAVAGSPAKSTNHSTETVAPKTPTPLPAPAARWDTGAAVASHEKFTNSPAKTVAAKTTTPSTAPAPANVTVAPVAAPVTEVPIAAAPAVPVKPVALPDKPQPPLASPPATLRTNASLVVTKTVKTPAKAPAGVDLVTTTGAIYRAALVSKVELDGLIISYVPAGGGIALTKVYFEDLPEEVREQYEKPK